MSKPHYMELDTVSGALRDSVLTHIRESIDNYVHYGYRPGDFVTAVLRNDLMEAVGRADIHSQANLVQIVRYVYNAVPSSIWGTRKQVEDHIHNAREWRYAQESEAAQ